MSLHYDIQTALPIIGTRSNTTLTGVTLENTYQAESSTTATKSFKTAGISKLGIDLFYTMGAAETSNTIQVKVEASADGVNWVRLATDTTTGGSSVLAAREFTFMGTDAGLATINIFLDVAYSYMRVSVKETGVAANKGTLFAEATFSG